MDKKAPVYEIKTKPKAEKANFRSIAVDSLKAQSEALELMSSRIDSAFDNAVNLILACKGRTIISGMGKSGLVGKKMAATFASTGTPSFFIHPAEAFHGDLGMITSEDLLILISYSGETEEVSKLLPSLKHFDCNIISMVGKPGSTLGQHSDVILNVAVDREVCPNNLAPTTSTMATMGMGDALAVALINARDFKPTDFAVFHPGGSLGRKLLTQVRDVMNTHVPSVKPNSSVHECLFVMTSGRLGLAIMMEDGKAQGIITDGELRRAMLKDKDILKNPVSQYASLNPVTVTASTKLSDPEELMRSKKISAVIVTGERGGDEGVCGVLAVYS